MSFLIPTTKWLKAIQEVKKLRHLKILCLRYHNYYYLFEFWSATLLIFLKGIKASHHLLGEMMQNGGAEIGLGFAILKELP